MVADDILHPGLLDMALDAQQMVEALIAFCGLGRLIGGEHRSELCCEGTGIDHLALGIARVDAHTFYIYARAGGIEVLELELAHIATVHGIGPLAAELPDIEMVGAHAYLLIRVEGDADIAVADLLMVAQIAHGLHDLCNAGLVVGSQQGVAVGDDQVFAYMLQQLGKLAGAADDAFGEEDVAAVVMTDNAGLDAFA